VILVLAPNVPQVAPGIKIDLDVKQYFIIDGAHRIKALQNMAADPECRQFDRDSTTVQALIYMAHTPAHYLIFLSTGDPRVFCVVLVCFRGRAKKNKMTS
jgi:hypothetical protein